MKKRTVSLLLAVVMLFTMSEEAYAHGKEGPNGHDAFLSRVLFGDDSYKKRLSKTSDEYKAIVALEDAVALCLDNSQNYQSLLQYLSKTMHIRGLPKKIEDIYFGANQYHRKYTHRGWNFNYPSDKANWSVRKSVLLQTVNKVFEFQKVSGEKKYLWFTVNYGYNEQCDAFAELLYLIHILADYEDSVKKYDKPEDAYKVYVDQLMPVAVEHAGDENEDIFWELERILPVIFPSQASDPSYCGLITDIRNLRDEARHYVKDTPDLKSNYFTYRQYALDLLEKLESKIPGLLRKEAFFSNMFYVAG